MEDNSFKFSWEKEGWFDQVSGWIDEKLTEHGWKRNGGVEFLHKRPWSAFARIETDQGVVFFKAPAQPVISEAPITAYLRKLRPDCIVPIVAIEAELGWMLTIDSGVTIRELSRTLDQIQHWHHILPVYAGLQRQLTSHVPALFVLGASDRRLAVLPEKFSQLLDDTENLRIGLTKGLTAEEHQQLINLIPTFTAECQELAAANIPETLTHEEVTEVNVILGKDRYFFTDWDNSIAHPFFSMLTTIGSIAHWVTPTPRREQLDLLRDLYLDRWTDIASYSVLLKAYEIAYRIAMVNRALSYHRTFAPLPQSFKVEYDGIVSWLRRYLNASAEI